MKIKNWICSLVNALRVRLGRSKRRRLSKLNAKSCRIRKAAFAVAVLAPVLSQPASAQQLQFSPTSYPVGADPRSVAISDLNGDGINDLAVANVASDNISLLFGNGSGSFGQVTLNAMSPFSITTSDFDGDGSIDIAYAQSGSPGFVHIVLGNGDGTFSDSQSFEVGNFPNSIVADDFNGDSHCDLAVSTTSGIEVLLGDGDGTFQVPVFFDFATFTNSCQSDDFNGDGVIDIAAGSSYDDAAGVMLGIGDGSFEDRVLFGTNFSTLFLRTGEFNGDGFADLAVSGPGGLYGPSGIRVMLGQGDGTFVFQPPQLGNQSFLLAVSDINGDGFSDISAQRWNGSSLTVFSGDGQGGFSSGSSFSTIPRGHYLENGDLDGDGLEDLVVLGIETDEAQVFLNRSCPGNAIFGDVNRDGVADLLDVSPFVDLLTNGQFQCEADVERDGSVDLLDVAAFVEVLQN